MEGDKEGIKYHGVTTANPVHKLRGFNIHFFNSKKQETLDARIRKMDQQNQTIAQKLEIQRKRVQLPKAGQTSRLLEETRVRVIDDDLNGTLNSSQGGGRRFRKKEKESAPAHQEVTKKPIIVDDSGYFTIPSGKKLEDGFFCIPSEAQRRRKRVFLVKGGKSKADADKAWAKSQPDADDDSDLDDSTEGRLLRIEAELNEMAGLHPPETEMLRLTHQVETKDEVVEAERADDEITGPRLVVTVKCAYELMKRDLIKHTNPYAVVRLDGVEVQTTIKRNTLEPEWNETFNMKKDMNAKRLRMEAFVYDWDARGVHELLGQGAIELDDLVEGEASNVEASLFVKDKRTGGWAYPGGLESGMSLECTAIDWGLKKTGASPNYYRQPHLAPGAQQASAEEEEAAGGPEEEGEEEGEGEEEREEGGAEPAGKKMEDSMQDEWKGAEAIDHRAAQSEDEEAFPEGQGSVSDDA